MNAITQKLEKFATERNWEQFHSPKNLIMALVSEVGELSEIFQWLSEEDSKIENLSKNNLNRSKEEIADVFLYLIRLADKLNIDIIEEANKKIELNRIKYPIELAKNNAIKYNQRHE